MEEWEYLEGHRDLYKDVVMENEPPLTSPDGSRKRNPPERCPRPLYSRNSTQEHHVIPQTRPLYSRDSTQEDLTISHKSDNDVKQEIKEEEKVGMMEFSEGYQDSIKDVIMEQFSDTNPPERCPRPLYSRDPTQEDHTVPHHGQGEERIYIKVEVKEEEVETYVGGDQPSTEEVGMMMMKSEQDDISLPINTSHATRLRTRRMEAATAQATHVAKTLQRGRNWKSKQRATPMSFEEMVEMVKILEKEDYDSRLPANEKRLNLRKDLILEKVIDVLEQNFAVRRTKDQLRKRWSDLKLREQVQLKRILKVIQINPSTRPYTRRMEAATARAMHVTKTLQRATNGKSKQRATNMSFEEMVEMVKILEKEDYDSRLAANEKRLNLRKDLILEKVMDVLQQKFAVRRTKVQLRKRWSDLKLREQVQLKRILRVIQIRREKNKKVQNVMAQEDPQNQSQHEGDVLEGRGPDDASLFLACDVPETPEISSSDPGTRPCTRRMEAATAQATHVSETLQSEMNWQLKQKATNMSFEEMVEMVKIMEKEDYDSRLAIYEKSNLRKDLILEKVMDVLQQNFALRRTKDQLRKRWSDLKLREEDQLKRILKVIQIRREVQNVMAQEDPQNQSQHEGDVAEGRDPDDASLFLACDVPETPEISSSVQITDPRPDASTISSIVSDLMRCRRDIEGMQRQLAEMQGTLTNVLEVLTKF